MIDTAELRGQIARRNMTQQDMAKKLGITGKTFYLKMKKGVFSSTEISEMIRLLEIEDPVKIFFANDVACEATGG